MITIKSFGSSSNGNGYLIDDGHSQLLLECGISFKKIKEAMGFDFSKVVGCCITHEHGDHAKYVKTMMKDTSFNIYATPGTLKALNIEKDHRSKGIKYRQICKVGSWYIIPFKINHDVAEPCGFLFESIDTKERLLFVTDTYYVKYQFKDIDYLMCEMNYSKEIVEQKEKTGSYEDVLDYRIHESHFEMNNALKFIAQNTSKRLKEVWLLHLSARNSDPELFKRKTQEVTGVPVYIA